MKNYLRFLTNTWLYFGNDKNDVMRALLSLLLHWNRTTAYRAALMLMRAWVLRPKCGPPPDGHTFFHCFSLLFYVDYTIQ